MEPISTKNAMRRHQSTSLNKRAPSVLPIKVNSASSCSQLPISWDATQGKAPWTVMIALVDSVPFTFNVPQASGSNFAVNWDVPKLSQNTQALVAVADSTGATSGVSSFIDLNAGSGSCSAIQVDLDFVWYPTNNKNTAGHCTDWGISWQTEKSKNSGVKGTVSFTFLPEKGQPITVNAGTGANGAFKFTVPFDSGTKFLASANDEGNSGTGGVGDLYSVSNVGQSKSCVALKTVGNGLPKASGTLAPASTSTQSTSKGSTKTSTHGAAASNTSGTNSSAVSANDSSSDHKSNSTGTAVGATFGVLGALALLGILFWWLRKRQRAKEDEHKAWGGAANNGQSAAANVSPWRYSTSPYEAPQTNSRASAWLRRASGTAATGFRVLGRGANNNSQADIGHGRSGSITTSAPPHMQQATYRNLSVPEDNYALSSIGGANSPDHFPRSPSPTRTKKSGGGGQSIHSTVPDTALFPPPGPRSYGYDEGGYGIARQQRPMQQQQGWQHPSEANSPFADPVPNRSAGAVTMDGYQGPVSEIRKGTSSIDSQSNPSVVGRNLIHGRKDGSSAGGSSSSGHGRTVDGLGSDYIGPVGPTKTSIYDPYTHMSQLWDPNNHGEIADRINQAGRGAGQNMQPAAASAGYHGGFTRNGPGVQRVNAPITSEVMMPEQGMQRFVKTGQRKPTTAEVIDEDREELPYL